MFNINLTTLVLWLLPTFLRGNTLIAWIRALVLPLQNLHFNLYDFRIQKQYELSITPQVIWLEHMLNRIFDPVDSAIYIEDAGSVDQVYAYNKDENQHPVYVYNKDESHAAPILKNKDESAYQFYFIVKVPSVIYQQLLINNNSKMRVMQANLNKYRMFGTVYNIQSY